MAMLIDSMSLGYIGQRRLSFTKNYSLGNGYRFYSPIIKHFLSWDRVSPFGVGGINGYGYCQYNPVNQSDRSGKGPLLDLMTLVGEAFIGNLVSLGTDVEVAVTAESIVQAQLLGTDDAFLTAVMANPSLRIISAVPGTGFRVAIVGEDILLDTNEIMRVQGGEIFARLWDVDLDQIVSINTRSSRLTDRNRGRFSCGVTDTHEGEVLDLFRTAPGRREVSLTERHLTEVENSFMMDLETGRIQNYAADDRYGHMSATDDPPPYPGPPPSYAESLGLPPTYEESQAAELLRRRCR